MTRTIIAPVQSTLLLLDSIKSNRKVGTPSQTLALVQIVVSELTSTVNKISQSFDLVQSFKVIAPLYVSQHLNLIFGSNLHFSFQESVNQSLEFIDNSKRTKVGIADDALTFRQWANHRVFAQTLNLIQSLTVSNVHPTVDPLTFNQILVLTKYQTNPTTQNLIFYSYARMYKPDWRFIGGIFP